MYYTVFRVHRGSDVLGVSGQAGTLTTGLSSVPT